MSESDAPKLCFDSHDDALDYARKLVEDSNNWLASLPNVTECCYLVPMFCDVCGVQCGEVSNAATDVKAWCAKHATGKKSHVRITMNDCVVFDGDPFEKMTGE